MENVEHLDTENPNLPEVLCENETLNGATIDVIGFNLNNATTNQTPILSEQWLK